MELKKQQIDQIKIEIKSNLSFHFYLEHQKIPFDGKFAHSIYSKDDSPSLFINKDDRTFHCYSTGTHGDIIKYHMDLNKLGFVRALLELKDILSTQRLKTNKTYPTYKNNKKSIKNKLLFGEALIYAKLFTFFLKNNSKLKAKKKAYRVVLSIRQRISTEVYDFIYSFCKENDFSEDAKKYLKGRERKLKNTTIKKFRLLEIKNPFYLAACLKKKYPMDKLIRSGVFNDKRHFIFFYHRLLIPYLKGGKIISLRARAYPNINQKIKYLNLYGRNAKMIFNSDTLSTMKPHKVLCLCEGEFDTMIAYQNGFNAIGFPGVNGIPFNVLKNIKLERFVLYNAFDADKAGDKAAQELCDKLAVKMIRTRPLSGKDLSEVYDA